MFTIEEYLKSRQDLLKAQIELINLRAAFRLSLKLTDDKANKVMQDALNLFVSEETKTHIYDSRTIEERKTETELNTETIG